ncbi:O-acyltransferase wsd1-like [Thalictrum thalictroides]|uniref:O-acyltransferase wsd1-like n=1 Tax=Thalictrum thalictroides TaxID=46969 RepID=A0A7J6WNZ9_THATH|nr:O-acyltransferase wsd1-like [Thalictrum thalictroides]
MDSNGVGEEGHEPVSPTGQYFNSSVLSVSVICALESEIPIDDSSTLTLLKNVFLPINPRFSSIMIKDDHGVKQWKRVDVKPEDHIHKPIFADGLSPEAYDVHLQDYLSSMAMDKLPQSRPLWEIHIFKYPTSNAAGTLIFKLHHALGDGFSLMSALFSCFQRADDPSLPITFPSIQLQDDKDVGFCKIVPNFFSKLYYTTTDFAWSALKSKVLVDDKTPIRSGTEGVEFLPITISTVTFSLDTIKQIKAKVGGTVNDVLVGTIFYGTRLYMQNTSKGSSNASSTALVLLNTRVIHTYRSLKEMVKPDAESPWGNQFGFLHVSIPEFMDAESADPLKFVHEAKETIKRKKNSLAVFLTGGLLDLMRKIRGPETTARYIHSTLQNTSMTLSNMIGPSEQIALANHPCKGMYFMVVAVPQSLTITMVSYMGKVRVAVGAEKGFINHQQFTACMEKAFERIFKAAINS